MEKANQGRKSMKVWWRSVIGKHKAILFPQHLLNKLSFLVAQENIVNTTIILHREEIKFVRKRLKIVKKRINFVKNSLKIIFGG